MMLQAAKAVIEKCTTPDSALKVLGSLERGHEHLLKKAETLYASLNVQDKFPELKGINLEFNQHTQGGNCTKLHQQTQKAIAKRQPALTTALCKFNKAFESHQHPERYHDGMEEQRCLGVEANNICQCFGEELAAIELAPFTPLRSIMLYRYAAPSYIAPEPGAHAGKPIGITNMLQEPGKQRHQIGHQALRRLNCNHVSLDKYYNYAITQLNYYKN
ncbi:hypothetical protein SERLA73DRAFT_149326 [Serpula lacrymans var. lacrymans S7.3]|uniref:Uncharacterized protein n=1 Tax=Serpula lacrymans var. lacrymans (strain S7.3) TaxID=936435 RepID=F8PHQ9_SERL3|nr:hypothetical protein SERLA73DRAFT_149326 [Serpula lacrymans var. lacrymans S7.3]